MKQHGNIFVETIEELRNWLEKNHTQSESVWLIRYKKASGKALLKYGDIVDELLSYGWVDSLPRSLDDEKTMLLISPRNPKSNWSKINKDKAERLAQEGRMKAAGMQMMGSAKENGAWDFLNDVEQLIIPSDLTEALNTNSKAAYYFNRFPDSSKRGILEWIKTAKQPETRAKRIAETARMAAENKKANFPEERNAGPKQH